MRLDVSTVLLLGTLLGAAEALHFLIDPAASSPKCFYEELPKDTLVSGHYKALQTQMDQPNTFQENPDLAITVTVEETFDNDHRIINTKGSSSGKFTFSAANAGDHRICFLATSNSGSAGWLSGGQLHGQVKLTLDMAIGGTAGLDNGDKGRLSDLALRIQDLNGRLLDIRREQIFQRVLSNADGNADEQEREAEFRDQSESTNARVVRWTLMQLVVLGVTCAWQLSHLRAFFIKQKLT